MNSLNIERPITNSEREYLKQILQAASLNPRWKQGVKNAFVLFAACMLILDLSWLALAWLSRKIFHVEFGLHSPAAIWIISIGACLCAIYAIVSTIRWLKAGHDVRPLLQADLDGMKVIEERYKFTAVKRFQEQEHGGLIYFLRTNDDRVLTLFDEESQNLGVSDGDPLMSSFKPQSELIMVRAPNTKFVISKLFSGTPLQIDAPSVMGIGPDQWPESEEYCSIPWNKLDRRLAGRLTK